MSSRPISEDDLHAFVDQALDPARRTEVAEYLKSHPDVAGRVEDYRRQRESLRAALAPIAEEPVPSRLDLRRLIEARRASRVGWRAAAVAAAAAIVLLCGGAAGGWMLHDLSQPPAGGIAALASQATESFEVYASDHVRPVELRAEDRTLLVDWASQRLGRAVTAPDLSRSGYRFMGGRLVATPQGPAVLFMYDDDRGTRLAVLSRRMAVDQDAPMRPHSRGSTAGFAWAENGIGYSLVGPLPAEALHPIANEVRRQERGI
ncbi:anti-sigma factor [Rhodoplanes sp. TEM]|uniref:Anti-sigma factor n=1 Tax=Rhodoplanes tepidamans TaxID=200616 RepID=A0ABT5JJK1_RHOTP|nr:MULTISPECIES: anti-sigma factor [Rhodoplanes]MDC7789895.1 anti-sigma factor [Rhodoplanes tepidamans]MDC7985584.1 anti-sigma factor [Rhodoplanes sp. TEM]MDQ0358789.1 anti-sigma factor RsiW [Rhodoplanes tepidamans]